MKYIKNIKKVLVTVKAYPNPSKKYIETVCAAGIDIEEGKWIRLYPIPFRDLELKKDSKNTTLYRQKSPKPLKIQDLRAIKSIGILFRLLEI